MTKIKYDFGSGRSDPETFPVAALQAAASKVIEEQAEALTQYPGDLGHAGMRAAMAAGWQRKPVLVGDFEFSAIPIRTQAASEQH